MRTLLPRRRAFTLIELLTVIAIIGILAAMLVGVTAMAKQYARTSSSKQMFNQWCTAVEQYKAAYSTYPVLNNQYNSTSDTEVLLSTPATVTQFIKCMTGRNPIYAGSGPLSTGVGGDARTYNRNGTQFCAMDPNAFNLDGNGAYTQLLNDAYGNTKIRLVMDTDGDGRVKPVEDLSSISGALDSNGYVSRPVIVFTLKSDNPSQYQNILSWQ